MDSNYQPSFEVVDKAEDAEDYLLAKNRRTTTEQPQPTSKVDATMNYNTSTNSDIVTTDKDKMNLNGTLESNTENGNVVAEDCDVLKCITEDEEGQEALWLEEAEASPSASSANASPAVNMSSTKRSSFPFGSGGISKKSTDRKSVV